MTRDQRWKRDSEIERMTAEFLDKYFYTDQMFSKATIKRYSDKYHQYGGVDLSINDTNFDEKCKYQGLLNKVCVTPGFECQLNNKANQIQDGWLLNSDLSTDFYALISLSCNVDDDKQLSSSSQISACDVLWIKKSDMLDFIQSFSDLDGRITIKKLKKDINTLRFEGDNDVPDVFGKSQIDSRGRARFHYSHRKYWLTYSTKLEEKPINLVVHRDEIEKFPHTRHFIVTKQKVVKV